LTLPSAPASTAQDLAAARRHIQAGEFALAVEAARGAAQANPESREAFAIWGIAAAELGAFAAAIDPLLVAAASADVGSAAWAVINSHLGQALCQSGHWAEGLARLTPVERTAPPDPMVRHRLGVSLVGIGLAERGTPHLEWAASAKTDSAELLYDLGWALAALGRLDEARTRLGEALALRPSMASAHAALARLRRWTPDENHIERLSELQADTGLGDGERAALGFALFKELDDVGRLSEAWPVLARANELARAQAPLWSASHDEALVAALIRRFPRAGYPPAPPASGGDRIPVFIVGLPRTGTTLLERILAAHSQVRAMGELPLFHRLFRAAAGQPDAPLTQRTVMKTKGADWRAVGARYLAATAPFTEGARFTIDKLPLNSLMIGPLRLALPTARIIFLRRNPMDALLSCHANWLGRYGWSYRLEDLAAHYRYHRKLMNHWRAALGPGLIEVSYENLVADPEPQIRALLAAVGLEFEAACLRPHEARGAVLTSSNVQVRAPITTAGVGAWRRYADPLEPLRARLAAWGLLDRDDPDAEPGR